MKGIVKTPKCYLTNNGLVSYLTNLNNIDILTSTGKIGHRFENWFLKELQTWLDKNKTSSNIFYSRTAMGAEVDFILDHKPLIYPMEVTFNTKKDTKKFRSLRDFMAGEPNAKNGFIIYRGDFEYDERTGIYFIPAWLIS